MFEKFTLPVTERVFERLTLPVTDRVFEKLTFPVTSRVFDRATLPTAVTLFWKAAVFTTWIQLFTVTFELNRAFDENVALEDIVIVFDVEVLPPRRLPVTTMTFAEK